MHFTIKYLILVVFTSFALHCFGISKDKKIEKILQEAEIEMLHNRYANAIELLNKAKKIDNSIAEIYFLQNEIGALLNSDSLLLDATQHLVRIFPENETYQIKNASILIDLGFYDEALNKLLKIEDSANIEVQRLLDCCQFVIQQQAIDSETNVLRLESPVNSNENEYWPSYSVFDSTLYFTRKIQKGVLSFERLYYVSSNCSDCVNELKIKDNPNISVGNIYRSADGRMLFFTFCGGVGGKGSCDLYYSIFNGNNWSQPIKVPAPVSTRYWEAQPMLSFDGSKLYFVSNREGGFGGMDIYQCDVIYAENLVRFENVLNLGKPINTARNDFAPFLLADQSTFYFSSDGHVGMGKSDLFSADFIAGEFSNVKNLGAPINSNFEEGGFTAGLNNEPQYFYSNRSREENQRRSKDLYQIQIDVESKNSMIVGDVLSSITGEHIDCDIQLKMNDSIEIIHSNQLTGFRYLVKELEDVDIQIITKGFEPFLITIDKEQLNPGEILEHNFELKPLVAGHSFVMENLLFDFDSDSLLENSKSRLNELIDFLEQNSTVKIEIIGHTDAVGSEVYNQKLSEKRAFAIYSYLIKKVDKSRLAYSGKGSSIPVADNDSELGRAKNRRTEIKILDLNHSINR